MAFFCPDANAIPASFVLTFRLRCPFLPSFSLEDKSEFSDIARIRTSDSMAAVFHLTALIMTRSFFKDLRLKHKYKQAFFQKSNCALLLCNNDPFSTIIDANDAFYRLVGFSREEMVHEHDNRFANLVIDNLSQILEKVAYSLQDNSTLDYEFRIRNKEGKTLWIHDIATYDKELDCFFVVIMDITYQQNALDAIVKTTNIDNLTRWLSSLIDNIPNPIAIFNDHEIVLSNKNFQHMKTAACPSGDLAEIAIFDTHIQRLWQKNQAQQKTAQENHAESQFDEIDEIIETLGGKTYRIKQQALTQLLETGEFSMIVFDDITLLQEKQLALSKAIEARNHFLAIISHELRTPIAAMIGLMRLLTSHLQSKESRQLLDSTIQSAQRLNLHVNDILDFSKMEADQLELDRQPIRLFDEINATLATYQPLCQEKGILFSFDWQPTPIEVVQLDWPRIQQIFNNILTNAIKFTSQGAIEVAVNLQHNKLNIEVKDSGCGMSQAQLASLYTPFQQGDKTISRRFGGTGLGLSIVKRLVDLMSGEIDIISEINIGTTVKICLPCSVNMPSPTSSSEAFVARSLNHGDPLNEASAQPQTTAHLLTQATSKPIHILVVDDDPINRLVFSKQLDNLGVVSTVVESGKEALQTLKTQPNIGLIITDIHMPEMNGYEFSRHIRQCSVFHQVPIIGCTADNSKEVIMHAQHAGIDKMIFKPYSVDALEGFIKHYLVATPETSR